MNNLVELFPGPKLQTLVALPESSAPLPWHPFELECLDAYFARRRQAQNHAAEAIQRDRRICERFRAYINLPLVSLTEYDFDRFIVHLVMTSHLKPNTQRTYQNAIEGFWKFLVKNSDLQNVALRDFGRRFEQVVTDENRITHKLGRETSYERRCFTHQEIDSFFGACDEAIADIRLQLRTRLAYARDKAMFSCQYYLALRLTEVSLLNCTSFDAVPWAPELKGWGQARVVGKGSKGSGPKPRVVPVSTACLGPILEWYLEDIRPRLLVRAKVPTKSLFVSERGLRISRSSIIHRMNAVLKRTDLPVDEFSSHCLRHAGITHDVLRAGMEFGKEKAGHELIATTQIYTHVPEPYQREQIVSMVRQTLDDIPGDMPRV